MRDATTGPIRLQDYCPAPYAATDIDLAFALDPGATLVTARTRFERRDDTPAGAPLALDGVRLELLSIAIDGQALPVDAYTIEPERLIVHAPPRGPFTLETKVRIDPAGNTALEGLYVSSGRFCTQCEAEGFRKITYALDRPDVLARYTVRVEADADAYPTLLSNGDLIDEGELADGRRFAVWRDPFPKPSYLFALVAGRFDIVRDDFVTRSGKRVALAIHVDEGDAPRALYAMDCLKRAMRWDEEAFGREYDLEVFNIVAVRDFNFGAMENKGLNIFNSAYVLADAETATDADFEAIESVVAHEYFHNWTGNRITCRDWFQLSLKEGLTVFRDQEFSAAMRSPAVQRIKDVKRLRARQFPEDAGPLAHPVRPQSYEKIDNFYTATVYEKGAEVIRALKRIIGDEAFARGMDLYFTRHDGQAATIEDFVAAMADASGQDLSGFMVWYEQAGTPRLNVENDWDAHARALTLRLRQHTPPTPGQSAKSPQPLPLRIGFVAESGAILAARIAGEDAARVEHAVVFDEAEATLRFEGFAARPTPAVLRGFSAPVTLADDLNEADRFTQMRADPDPFTRWEAGQTLLRSACLAAAAGAEFPGDALAAALSRELDRAADDPAFAALALRVPDLAELVQIADAPDPDRLAAGRDAVRRALAQTLEQRLAALASALEPESFSPDAASAGRRMLKTAALDLLAALGPIQAPRLEAAFTHARTMTESAAALDALGASGAAPAFDRALDVFYARWRINPLVLDKWFQIQAGAGLPDAIERVRALARHDAFDTRNPNRVRALVMPFATRNLAAFHAADGSGYAFVADLAGDVDAKNPALAARLLGVFESWRRFDAVRQANAQTTLRRLLERPGLSRNAHEIVTRTLG